MRRELISVRIARCLAALLIAVVFVVVATSVRADEKKEGTVPEAAVKEGREIFKTRCSVCHGLEGKGDGPGATGLNPKPRNLSDPEWQKSVDDAYIEKIIQYGGLAVGKSAMMPSNPDLNSKPEVIKGIRVVVRELAAHK